MKGFSVKIVVGDDGGLKWDIEGDCLEQQLLDVLRATTDQVIADRIIREVLYVVEVRERKEQKMLKEKFKIDIVKQ